MRNLVKILASSVEHCLVFAAASQLPPLADSCAILPDSFVWMPLGTHAINAHTVGGGSFSGTVICDAQAARAIQTSFEKITATGARVWLDFDHNDGEASAWVKAFSWDEARGILAHVEWSEKGAAALRGKAYYSFSPAFAAQKDTGRIVSLLPGHAAGGLVNAPAFTAMPALIAARLASIPPQYNHAPANTAASNQNKTMTKEQILALLAALHITPAADATVEQLTAIHAKAVQDQAAAAELAEVKAKLAAFELAASAKKKIDEEAAAAVQAKATSDKLAGEIVEMRAKIAAFEAGASGRAGPGFISVKPQPFEAIKAMLKETDSKKRGQIYCNDLRDFVAGTAQLHEILAANAFGTVTSDLIVLRALDLLKLRFPILSKITTDFSAGTVPMEGQNIKSRIVSVPGVTTYSTSTGWASSDATTTDVPVVIGLPVGVQISLQNTEIGSSQRDLFAEQAEAAHYALGKNMVEALYAVITQANFAGAEKRTIQALSGFARAHVIDMGTALSKRSGNPDRFMLLNSDYYGGLTKDMVAVANPALVGGNMLQSRALPRVQDFDIIEASNLPAAAFTSTVGALQGFGGTKDSLVIATRVPNDYTQALPGSSHGNVSVVTNPDTGVSVQKVDFVDHNLARAYSRIAVSFGVAKGNINSGQVLTQS